MTMSQHIKFTTATHMASRKIKNIVGGIKQVKSIHTARGSWVENALFDGEFEALVPELGTLGIGTNVTAANEHVPEIERQIQVIKEHFCCVRHTLPFKFLPRLLVVSAIYSCILWLNAFPPNGGVSKIMSPRTIMTGIPFDYRKHCCLQFGSYAQMHEDATNNRPNARTMGAICLGPTRNLQGPTSF